MLRKDFLFSIDCLVFLRRCDFFWII